MDNFIVSARKYRPATFESVVGQSHITSTLKNAIIRGQLAHAYLFCGPRGVGKTTCARIFAKAINCTSPVNDEACGECESCRSFNEGRSFSIHELDAASNNSVDDIRALTDQVRVPPQVGRYSVYIIDEVHMLSAAAFNAFLKTLEEPPAHAVFILATTEKHKIIPTILSRCQIYDFNRIRVEDSVGYLKHIASQESVTADDESLNLIAQKADGGMRDALSMFDKAVAFCGSELNFREVARTLNVLDYDTYFKVTDLAGEGDYKAALLLFDEVLRKGFSGLTFIAGLNAHFRDLLMCKEPGTLPLLEVTGTLLEKYKEQSARYPAAFLFQGMSLLSAVDSGFRTATNQRLHVELGLMKLCSLAQKKTELTNESPSLPPLKKGEGGADITSHAASPAGRSDKSEAAAAQPAASAGSGVQENMAAPAGTPAAASQGGTLAAGATGTGTAMAGATASSGNSITHTSATAPGSGAEGQQPSAPDSRNVSGAGISATTPEATTKNIAAEARPATAASNPGLPNYAEAETPAAQGTPSGNAPAKAPDSAQAVSVSAGAQASPAGNGRKGVSGLSIQDILKNAGAVPEGDEPVAAALEEIDPLAADKMMAAKDEFVVRLARTRPSLATAMETMTAEGNRMCASVSAELLKEDLLLHQKEVINLMREVSGVTGPIEIEVTVKEDNSAIRPIRPEDKLEHLRTKNPLLDELRRELNLEMD